MRPVFILFFGILLLSCGKKRSIHITATNAATGERYSGLQYFIVSSTTTGDGEKYKTEKTGFLTENEGIILSVLRNSCEEAGKIR